MVLLVLSAFFSGSETSLTGSSRHRMHSLEQAGQHRAALVNELMSKKHRLIGAILLGNNLVNILASALATSILIGLFGEAGVVYATIVMTLLVLIFAEVLPKTYAIHNADRMALTVAPILKPVVMVFAPVTQAIHWIVRGTLRIFRMDLGGEMSFDASEEELRGAIDLHAGEGDEERHERAMLRSILDLADVEVEEIMVHRRNVTTLNADLSVTKLVEQALESPYTRLPIWKNHPDNIIGVLHAKALLRAVQKDHNNLDNLDAGEIANEPWFIPSSTDLLAQLQALQPPRTLRNRRGRIWRGYGDRDAGGYPRGNRRRHRRRA